MLSDFGNKEHFVAAMKGVAVGVSQHISIFDITHEIEPFNVWEASWILTNAMPFWPPGTVFVAVVDPGVGTSRKSLAGRFSQEQIIICPDNGLLTFILMNNSNPELRMIDERLHIRPASETFHTFHGRDLYVYLGARLAAGIIDFSDTGPLMTDNIHLLDYQKARMTNKKTIEGTIMKVEEPFGNLVTDITSGLLRDLSEGKEISSLNVIITHDNQLKYKQRIPLVKSFGYVQKSEALAYSDSSGFIGLAVNSDSFAQRNNIQCGESWKVTLSIG